MQPLLEPRKQWIGCSIDNEYIVYMKKQLIALGLTLFSLMTFAQREVSQERMADIYEEVKTPYKYGLVLAPDNNNYKMDCPTVFREGNKWYMTYVI